MEATRLKNASNETDKVFAQFSNVDRATEIAKSSQGHNCYTLSLIALQKCKDAGLDARMLSTTSHACVLIGPKPTTPLPQNMKDWPKGYVICDPWAGFSCPAESYTQKFESTMNSWSSHGLVLIDGDGQNIAPNDAKWVNEVTNSQRLLSKGDMWPET